MLRQVRLAHIRPALWIENLQEVRGFIRQGLQSVGELS
jgi:hypothetical protein